MSPRTTPRFRGARSIGRVLVACTAAVTALVVGPARVGAAPVPASPEDDKRQEVAAIADELERLEESMLALAEDYAEAVNDGLELDKEIEAAEERIAAKQTELLAMQSQLQGAARRTFVGSSSGNSLAAILSSTGSLSDQVRKAYLTSVALNVGVGGTDELQAVIDQLAKERDNLERLRTKAGGIADYARKRLLAAEASASIFTNRQSAALAELGDLLTAEQARRAKAAAEAAAAQAAKWSTAKYTKVPAPSPAAATAVKAALSQLGVRYRFGALQPGVAFDCSGLTSYAWARAGIALPRSSRSQYSALTRVPIAAAQPGDLIFSYSPISHVGIYLGGGQMVHAPRTGDVVKVSYVSWAKVIGVGRPK
ncbi:MAG: NlpC/P60 family protein [Acidimicrobiia bacterium]